MASIVFSFRASDCSADLRRDAVGGKEKIGTFGNLLQVVDEDHPFVLEMLDNPAVVDDFVVDVNRCAVKGNGLFQALDRHIHSGTKAAGGGQYDSHGFLLVKKSP